MRVVANSLYQSCPKGVGNNIAGYRNQVVLSSYRPIKEATLPSIVLDCSSFIQQFRGIRFSISYNC